MKEQEQKTPSPMYEPAGFYMLRAPTLSANTFKFLTSIDAMATESALQDIRFTDLQQHGYEKVKQLAADPAVQRALLIASVDMLEGLERIQRDTTSPKRIAHVYASILRYLVRMCTRPTPFGLFSGVAVGTLAEQTSAQLGTPAVKLTRTRPDMGWLLALIQQIEENTELLPLLTIVANHTAYIAGSRAIIPYADVYGKGDNRSIALRATDVVKYVIRRAQEPVPYQTLREETRAAFPFASTQQVESLLSQLWQHHFLISDLRPPLTSANPENYVLERLLHLSQPPELTSELAKIVETIKHFDQAATESSTDGDHAQLRDIIARQHTLVTEEIKQTLQVDAALHLEAGQLNHDIGTAVADVTEVLLHLTHAPDGPQHLREYFVAFAERYGMNREVPLLDLLSPEIGLGAPGPYTEPPRDFPLPAQPSTARRTRDMVLCSLLAEVLYKHEMEVELTDERVQALTLWTPAAGTTPPAALEMYLQIHATSRAALDQGEWRGVLTNQSYGGRTFCRFFDVLSDDGVRMLKEYAKREEALSPDCIFAELSYLPTMGHGANVVIRPPLRDYEIVLNTTPSVPPERVIPLQDLVVGIKEDRFYIRSLSLQKEVRVTQSHMLNITRAPNICRFLIEVSQDGQPQPTLFGWGSASDAPFLPRVVRKHIVLHPAQWNVRPSMIEPTGPGNEEARFFSGVQQWREQWHVPRYVYLTQYDNRLLLDLENPLLVAELRHELEKREANESVTLQEMLPDFEHLWMRDTHDQPYMAEMVIPLLLRDRPEAQRDAPKQKQARNSPKQVLSDLERSFLPGEEWTYLKLYVIPRQQDEVIAGPLREIALMLQQQELIDRWFFIRYADPEPHLRVRFHARSEQTRNAVLLTALTWGQQLVRGGLLRNMLLDTYTRETERYGGPRAIAALEDVFTVNSVALTEIIAASYRGDITLDPLLIDVFTLDQFFSMWGLDLSARLIYTQKRTGKHDGKELFRPLRRQLCELLLPWETTHDPLLQEQRTLLQRLCAFQEPVLQHVSTITRTLAAQGELWVDEEQLLSSLAHMQSNRLLGTSRDEELKGYAFWRHTLESLFRRPDKPERPTGEIGHD